jgi:hypothetical protein
VVCFNADTIAVTQVHVKAGGSRLSPANVKELFYASLQAKFGEAARDSMPYVVFPSAIVR